MPPKDDADPLDSAAASEDEGSEPDDDAPVEYTQVAFDTNTSECAVSAFLMMQYTGWDMTYIVPILISLASQMVQIVLSFEFMQVAELMEDMYETVQFAKVREILTNATSSNQLFTAQVEPLYSQIYTWANLKCGVSTRPDPASFTGETIDAFKLVILMLWAGKCWKDVSAILWHMLACIKTKDTIIFESIEENTDEAAEGYFDARGPSAPGKTCFRACNFLTQCLVFFFVFLPHLITYVVMWWLGTKYISLQNEVVSIIRSTLKVTFIVDFDAMFVGLYSPYFASFSKGAHYEVIKKNIRFGVKDEGFYQAWETCGDSVTKIIVFLIWALIAKYMIFPTVGELDSLCNAYYNSEGAYSKAPWRATVLGNATVGYP